MRAARSIIIGIILIVIGGVAIGYDQISYTRREKVLDIGPLEATVDREAHCVRLPIIFGVLVIIAGVALIAFDRKKRP